MYELSRRHKRTFYSSPTLSCIVDQEGNRLDSVRIEVLKDFLTPKDLINLKSYLGFVNQLGEFSLDLKHSLQPLKPLLSSKNTYNRNRPLQKAFEKSEVPCSDQ